MNWRWKIGKESWVEEHRFSLRLPAGPTSYIGMFGQLLWALELVVLPSRIHTRVVFPLTQKDGAVPVLASSRHHRFR